MLMLMLSQLPPVTYSRFESEGQTSYKKLLSGQNFIYIITVYMSCHTISLSKSECTKILLTTVCAWQIRTFGLKKGWCFFLKWDEADYSEIRPDVSSLRNQSWAVLKSKKVIIAVQGLTVQVQNKNTKQIFGFGIQFCPLC